MMDSDAQCAACAIFEQPMRYSKGVSWIFVRMISIMLDRLARLLKVSRKISDSKA
jgi:hypothetical protein